MGARAIAYTPICQPFEIVLVEVCISGREGRSCARYARVRPECGMHPSTGSPYNRDLRVVRSICEDVQPIPQRFSSAAEVW